MAFDFEALGRKVQDIAFAAGEKAQQVAAVATEKAGEVADKAKTEYDIAGERRSIDKNYRAIGEWYVSTLDGEAPAAVADVVAAIHASQEKIAAYEAAKAEAAAKKAEGMTRETVAEVTIKVEKDVPVAEAPAEAAEQTGDTPNE